MNREIKLEGLKVYVIKRPYDFYSDNESVRYLMTEMFEMKLRGYRSHYNYGVLPCGDLDFISDHIMITKFIDGRERVLSAFRCVKYSACKDFRIPFPGLKLITSCVQNNRYEFYERTNEWIQMALNYGDIGFSSSWTMDRDIMTKKELIAIKQISLDLFVLYYSKNVSNVLAQASIKYGVPKLHEQMGFEFLKNDSGEKLGELSISSYFEVPIYVMHLTNNQWSNEYLDKAKASQSLWDGRTEISKDSEDLKIAV